MKSKRHIQEFKREAVKQITERGYLVIELEIQDTHHLRDKKFRTSII